MNKIETFVVEFVARGASAGDWSVVLVEQGPWPASVSDELLRVQDRLYNCVDAVLDGQLAQEFPESKGAAITIRLDCYNVPAEEVKTFFKAFSEGIFEIPDYRQARIDCPFARDIRFELNIDAIN
jgi:hypothetical protein